MPYDIKDSHPRCGSGQVAVVKRTDGQLMGCHDSKQDAQKQIAALYANEK